MIKKIVFLSTACMAIALIIFMLWYKFGISAGFACSGNVNFHKDSAIMRLSTKLNINGSSGTLSMNGFVVKENGERESVNRTVVFTSHHIGTRYTWISKEVISSIDENLSPELSRQWLPDFYRLPKNKVELYITRLNLNSVMLSGDFIPYYVCTQRH